jgi:hypothetical protein
MSQHIIKWEQMRDMILIRLTLIYQPMKMGIAKNMKMLLNCFSSYEQIDWPKHIFIISLHKVTHMWPLMGFPQISHATNDGQQTNKYL